MSCKMVCYIININKRTYVHNVVFLEETWIFQNDTIARSWQDADLRFIRSTKVDSKRRIVVYTAGNDGFISCAKLVFSSKTKNADHHGVMNQINFLKWLRDLLLILPDPLVITIDNARYHNTRVYQMLHLVKLKLNSG